MISEQWTRYARAGEPVARGKISLVRCIYCCLKFLLLLLDQRLYIVKNVCIYTYMTA